MPLRCACPNCAKVAAEHSSNAAREATICLYAQLANGCDPQKIAPLMIGDGGVCVMVFTSSFLLRLSKAFEGMGINIAMDSLAPVESTVLIDAPNENLN